VAKRGRVGLWFERVALGTILGVVAFVAERRLMKVVRRRSKEEAEGSRSGRP
jgi:hypothetical protein